MGTSTENIKNKMIKLILLPILADKEIAMYLTFLAKTQ